MSIVDLSASCVVCKEYLEHDYSVYELGMRCAKMVEMAEKHTAHMYEHRKLHKKYAFTFTTNLEKEQIQADMIDSCHRLFRQQTVPIEEGEAYLEYTKEGRPHIHGWYETRDGGRVFAKIFQRCWSYWKEERGKTKFAGGMHEEMKSDRYKAYSSAEGRVICSKKKGEDCIYTNAPSEDYADEETRRSGDDC